MPNEMGSVGINAAGKWDMHPGLRETQWCKEEHEIKTWIELREQERCCHEQSQWLQRAELKATFLSDIT